jgi:hypothetical protein
MLAVADAAAAAEAAAAGVCSGLWQLPHASGVSNQVQLDAVVAAGAPPSGGDDGGGDRGQGLTVSAALASLQLRLSEHQAAALAAVAGAVSAEARCGFRVPLLEAPAAEASTQSPAWLAGCSLSIDGGLRLAYSASGGLQRWVDPRGAAIAPPDGGDASRSDCGDGGASSGTSPRPEAYLSLGSVSAALTAAAHQGDPSGPRPVVLQAQLAQPVAWLLPVLHVQLPAAEARLGLSSHDGTSSALLSEPLLLAAGLSIVRRRQHTAVQLGSLSVAVGAAAYPLLAFLMRCWTQQPALLPQPALRAAGEAKSVQVGEGSSPSTPAEHAGQAGGTLAVRLDTATLTAWPQPPPQQAQEQPAEQQPGLAVWLSRLRYSQQQQAGGGGGGSSSTDLSLGALHAAMMRGQQDGGDGSATAVPGQSPPSDVPLELSQVLSFPAAAGQAAQQAQHAALTLSLTSSVGSRGSSLSPSPGRGQGGGGRRLQVRAAPLSLAVSRQLLAAAAAVARDLGGAGAGAEQAQQAQQAQTAARPEPEQLQGKATLLGLRLLLQEQPLWQGSAAPAQPLLRPQAWRCERPAPPGAAAVEVECEEAVVLLQQAPAAENRPWLAGEPAAAAALITAADASLIGAAVTVWHAGEGPCCFLHAAAAVVAALAAAAALMEAVAGSPAAPATLTGVVPPPRSALLLQARLAPTPPRCCPPSTAGCS